MSDVILPTETQTVKQNIKKTSCNKKQNKALKNIIVNKMRVMSCEELPIYYVRKKGKCSYPLSRVARRICMTPLCAHTNEVLYHAFKILIYQRLSQFTRHLTV